MNVCLQERVKQVNVVTSLFEYGRETVPPGWQQARRKCPFHLNRKPVGDTVRPTKKPNDRAAVCWKNVILQRISATWLLARLQNNTPYKVTL